MKCEDEGCKGCPRRKKKAINACYKCGEKDVKIRNCGYSSFNVGSGECPSCGFKVNASNGDWDNDDWIINEWNFRNPTKEQEIERLEKQVNTLQEKIKKLKKEHGNIKYSTVNVKNIMVI